MKIGFKSLKLTPSELITLTYILITTLIIAFTWGRLESPFFLLSVRILVAGGILILAAANRWYPDSKAFWFVRNMLWLALIVYWYPETYYLGKGIMPTSLDHLFVDADQWLFGCQPFLEFSKAFPQLWLNELMNFGYFSYFFMILGTSLFFYFRRREISQKAIFIVLCSFFMYYLIFIFLPVMGPQFYFPAPENSIPDAGLFRYLLINFQSVGENPTGAFPSSHVGICVINLILLYKYARKGFYMLLPIAIVLVCSTIYIKAHYLIDVIAGFISAPLIYWLSLSCWRYIARKQINI